MTQNPINNIKRFSPNQTEVFEGDSNWLRLRTKCLLLTFPCVHCNLCWAEVREPHSRPPPFTRLTVRTFFQMLILERKRVLVLDQVAKRGCSLFPATSLDCRELARGLDRTSRIAVRCDRVVQPAVFCSWRSRLLRSHVVEAASLSEITAATFAPGEVVCQSELDIVPGESSHLSLRVEATIQNLGGLQG